MVRYKNDNFAAFSLKSLSSLPKRAIYLPYHFDTMEKNMARETHKKREK